MSTLAKVFVVLNMILAITFAVASLTLYNKRIPWVEESNKNIERRNQVVIEKNALQKQLDELKTASTAQIEALKVSCDASKKESDTYKSEHSKQLTRNDELKASLDSLNGSVAQLTNDLSKAREQIESLQGEKEKMIAERNTAIAAKEFAEQQAIEVTADLRQAEAENLQLAKRNANLVEQLMESKVVMEKVRERVDLTQLLADKAPTVPISGRVLQVESAVGLVILNIGEKNNVKTGMEFVISRGSDYVGKVRVRRVYEKMCSANIIEDLTKAPIEISDIAQTM